MSKDSRIKGYLILIQGLLVLLWSMVAQAGIVITGNHTGEVDLSNATAPYSLYKFEDTDSVTVNGTVELRGNVSGNVNLGNPDWDYTGAYTPGVATILGEANATNTAIDVFENLGKVHMKVVFSDLYDKTNRFYLAESAAYFNDWWKASKWTNEGEVAFIVTGGRIAGTVTFENVSAAMLGDGGPDGYQRVVNRGTILASYEFGNIDGTLNIYASSSMVVVGGLNNKATVINAGTIGFNVKVGDVAGNFYIGAEPTHNISMAALIAPTRNDREMNLENTGTIYTRVEVGDSENPNGVKINGLYTLATGAVRGATGAEPLTVKNSGTVLVDINTGTNARIDYVSAVGIFDNGHHTFENTGRVLTKVNAGAGSSVSDVAGIHIAGTSNGVNVVNEGVIAVESNMGTAYGILISEGSVVGLSSSGTIDVKAPKGYAVYAKDSSLDVSGAVLSVVGRDRVGIIGAENSTVDVTGLVVNIDPVDLKASKIYPVVDADENSTVLGRVKAVNISYKNPDFKTKLLGNSFMLEYDPKVVNTAGGIHSAINAGMAFANRLNTFLFQRSVLPVAMKSSKPIKVASLGFVPYASQGADYLGGFYLIPVVSQVRASDLGYDADYTGVIFGLEDKATDNIVVGMFGGLGWGDVDYMEADGNSDLDIYTAGLYATWAGNNLFATGSLSWTKVNDDYDGRTGWNMDIKEHGDTDITAYAARFTAGFGMPVTADLVVVPYAGLEYLYVTADSYTLHADDPMWNKHIDDYDEDFITGIAGVRMVKAWNLEGGKAMLHGGIKVRYAFDDPDIEVTQKIPALNAKGDAVLDVERTVYGADLGFAIAGKRIKFEIDLELTHNSDMTAAGGYATITYMF